MRPRFTPGTDKASATTALTPLLTASGGRWTLTSEGGALERSFKFKTFAKTWVYNTTFIRWTTHSPEGLSEKDVSLATLCDSVAKDFGELDPEPTSCEVRTLADEAVSTSRDCCTSKSE
ncbi:hypothetical protein C2857_006938 [Epichloe festucae Fl1]|uniref:4a-hydroxytetrahydrobiopterin dehydratase n=1 Tax=Epichloe festucae (strain Fl1) TaxID=877507 RepID=A0A7S9PT63_EPIFF|nr:hypothetical protein C2857_006938 [Epichloe festucae Fl1]